MTEDQFNRTAEMMFGASTPTSAPAPSVPALDAATDEMAQRLFGNAPRTQAQQLNEQQTTEDEMAQRLFGDSDPALYFGDSMRSIEQAAVESFMASPEEAAEAATHWGSVFQDAGLTGSESVQIAEAGIAAFKAPPTAELVDTWVEQSQAVLVQDYGPKGARAALDDARRFVELHAGPELREVLETYGLGNHPAIVRVIAAKARALRQGGKLR